ncbi:MAG TPA: hypothetical protein VLJ86_15720 [Ramlibacter sp.]|nr:hypothetical protein [Ramlibacter sp.]
MPSSQYRIESDRPFATRLLPMTGDRQVMVHDRALAVALAAKSYTSVSGQEIRVVHVPTGEIVYRKNEGQAQALAEDF